MSTKRYSRKAALLAILAASISCWGQSGSQGKVVVTVQDSTGAVVQGAQLELRDLATNDVRKAETENNGTHTFVSLPLGTYKLSVSKDSFQTQVFDAVVVQAAQVTDVRSALVVGASSVSVEVSESETPLLTTDSAIGTTINMKQIEQLPLGGRDLTQLSQLVPGYNGTWNGLPEIAQSNNIDGVVGSPSRAKYAGNSQSSVEPRVEDIEEMTIQTGQLDLDQGYGASDMQINFVTRRGSNAFHGRLFGDFRNSALNANSWLNNANSVSKPHYIKNEFGGSIGGPILKNKLFFFADLSISRQPGSRLNGATVLSNAAQLGTFAYKDSNGVFQTPVNVLQIAQNSGLGIPSTVNSIIGSQLTLIDKNITSSTLIPNSADPNLQGVNWKSSSPLSYYFPTFRIDYNGSEKYHFGLAYNQTRRYESGIIPSPLPGPDFANRGAGNWYKNYSASANFDWLISPTLSNQFRVGYLYYAEFRAYNAGDFAKKLTPQVGWALGASGQTYPFPLTRYYPLINGSDTLSWQHGAHAWKAGFSLFREQNHYWDAQIGDPGIGLGIVNGDPAFNAFTNSSVPNATNSALGEARALYATLVGRISGVGGAWAIDSKTGQYQQGKAAGFNLDELNQSWGLFVQDSYRLRPNLTLNYGLRWDFTGDNHDLNNAYHGAGISGVFGPTAPWDLFNPGSLKGTMDPTLIARQHQYAPWKISPQPSLGFAWDPLKDGKTILRGGFSLRKYTESEQVLWSAMSNFNSFVYQSYSLNPSSIKGPGFFAPGSLALGDTLPAYLVTPAAYAATAHESASTFFGQSAWGVEPKIRQPYTESWNFGIQHAFNRNNVMELRYVGNRSIHQFTLQNTNEINVFQTGPMGVLTNFKTAQANLQACMNNAGCAANPSFANNGLPGQAAMPLFDAAFAGEKLVNGQLQDYSDFMVPLVQQGQVGAIAGNLATTGGNALYFCNLVGSSFTPCVTNAGYGGGAGAGLPINFLQANPYAGGYNCCTGLLTDAGYATYHSLQADVRQKQWHGMQFDANYTWSRSLGTHPATASSGNAWLGINNSFSLRNPRLSYVPAFDIRHVLHASGTYDLPFGKGRQFLNRGGVLNKVVGGWTLGTIMTYQSGSPFQLFGGYQTFNDYGDGGVTFNGVTLSQLQSSVGVHRVSVAQNNGPVNFVQIIDPKYLASAQGGVKSSLLLPNSTPGTFGKIPFLYGPRAFFDDLAITKSVALTERLKFSLQGEYLNVFNHPVFATPDVGLPDGGVQSSTFGIATGPGGDFGRVIEMRANIEF